MKIALQLLAASMLLALSSCFALAQTVSKTWVSGTGTDSGSCGLAAPCRSFQYALNQTIAGGEILVKDAGAYGPVTITKAMTIEAVGVEAEISVSANAVGIVVNAGPSDVIVVRGIRIDGNAVGNNVGIGISAGQKVIIDQCQINGNASGVYLANASTFSLIEHSLISNNNIGVQETNSSFVFLSNDTIAGNITGLVGSAFNSFSDNIISDDTSKATIYDFSKK